MSDAASNTPPPLEGVVNDDGSITVDPDQAARLGLRPGAHLTLVPVSEEESLADLLDEAAHWQHEQGVEISDEDAERIAVEASRDIRHRLNDQAGRG